MGIEPHKLMKSIYLVEFAKKQNMFLGHTKHFHFRFRFVVFSFIITYCCDHIFSQFCISGFVRITCILHSVLFITLVFVIVKLSKALCL